MYLYEIKICSGSEEIETVKIQLPHPNQFGVVSGLATSYLFSTEGADNVLCFAGNNVGARRDADYFFYAEKG